MSLALTTIKLERVFLLKIGQQEITLADPSPNYSIDQVKSFYAPAYPVINNSKLEGPEVVNDYFQWCFTPTLGTKG